MQHRLKNTPIVAHQADPGYLKLVRYPKSKHLMVPLVEDVLATGHQGTTCVLTRTNEEALQVAGLLLKNGWPAKLIQTNDGFSLYNIYEVRCFLDMLKLAEGVFTITEETWSKAKRELSDRFRGSPRLEICSNIIKDFEATNTRYKYKSDLEVFIRESKLEDFLGGHGETIFVATIHKAKGKEFDSVFLLLENARIESEEKKREVYVAITRAKQSLTIHTNGNYFNAMAVSDMVKIDNENVCLSPGELVMHLTHKDIWLDFFQYKQALISQVATGERLFFNGEECVTEGGQGILRFSRQFSSQMENLKQKNYVLKTVKVNFILYWQKEGVEKEIKIILPELLFEKQLTNL